MVRIGNPGVNFGKIYTNIEVNIIDRTDISNHPNEPPVKTEDGAEMNYAVGRIAEILEKPDLLTFYTEHKLIRETMAKAPGVDYRTWYPAANIIHRVFDGYVPDPEKKGKKMMHARFPIQPYLKAGESDEVDDRTKLIITGYRLNRNEHASRNLADGVGETKLVVTGLNVEA